MYVIKKDGTREEFNIEKIIAAVNKSAARILYKFSDDEIQYICAFAKERAEQMHKEGISIPDSLSVIGYNNSILAQCSYPELTSIDSKVEELCITTVNTLMGVFDGSNEPARTTISADIIKRGTTH